MTRTMKFQTLTVTALLLGACGGDDGSAGSDETAGSETATDSGTADEVGDADATSTSTSTSDDTTTTTTTTESTTDMGCPVGSEGCPCTGGGGCDPGLMCMDGVCTPPAPDTTGPDTTSTSDSTTTDTGGTACNMDVSFEVLAVDATDATGWDPFMSMLGEGMIMAWDNQTQDATISWDLDVPCDDTWHVWVRGIDQGQNDSFFAMVDGEPNPPPIFELDCTQNPQQGAYVWKELNYRDPADPACTYTFDPWTQDWATGVHQFTLMYRESAAVSRLWITNTAGTPP